MQAVMPTPLQLSPKHLDDEALTIRNCKLQQEQFGQWLKDRFLAGDNINELVHSRATFIDELLERLWHKFQLDQSNNLSLVAVGGYGRRELHPHSDIDILILSKKSLSKEQQEQISQLITFLWDIRLDVGQSVRTVKECFVLGKEDITIATNLFEARCLCGDHAIFDSLQAKVTSKRFWPSNKFFIAKWDEQKARHQQYGGTGDSLEPDLKGNPGGLRDMQNISWVAGRHFGSTDLLELSNAGFLTNAEYRELLDCRDFLWRVRFALHLGLNKADNRLLFDRQTTVAETLGYQGEHNQPVEQLMKQFFQTSRRVTELNEMLLQRFDEVILGNNINKTKAIDGDFQIRGSLIDANTPDLFQNKPYKILQMFIHIAEHTEITGVYSTTLRQLRDSRRRLNIWLQDIPECRKLFVKLLKHPGVTGLPLTLMHRYGVLATYLPSWSKIVGQMQFDLFHAFTVDEHTHRLLQEVHNFSLDKCKLTHPLCHKAFKRLERPDLLVLAAIFHDIAKGRGGDHSELGAHEVVEFCKLHGYSRSSTRLVAWLVQHHLTMSGIAQRCDLQDPEVIKSFANTVRDERHLDMLLCLTVADIRATNNKLWNSWKASLLKELYKNTQRGLRLGLQKPVDIRDQIKEKRLQALELLHQKAYTRHSIDPLWKTFRADYFLRHTPAQIAWHTAAIIEHPGSSPLVLVSKRATRGGTEVFIYSPERDHLFASVAKVLDQKNLNILDARIMVSRTGKVMDTFVVLQGDGKPIAPRHAGQIISSLKHAVQQGVSEVTLSNDLPRMIREFTVPTQVHFLPTQNNTTMLEIIALDRPGLLAQVAAIFQESNLLLHRAKITTIGEQVEDFFTLTTENREQLDNEQKQSLKEKLLAALAPPEDSE